MEQTKHMQGAGAGTGILRDELGRGIHISTGLWLIIPVPALAWRVWLGRTVWFVLFFSFVNGTGTCAHINAVSGSVPVS
jgi:hypothetical protein